MMKKINEKAFSFTHDASEGGEKEKQRTKNVVFIACTMIILYNKYNKASKHKTANIDSIWFKFAGLRERGVMKELDHA